MTVANTPYYNLYKLSKGTRDWDIYLNDNFDVIDTQLKDKVSKTEGITEDLNVVGDKGIIFDGKFKFKFNSNLVSLDIEFLG